jgi:hypothetical protein
LGISVGGTYTVAPRLSAWLVVASTLSTVT